MPFTYHFHRSAWLFLASLFFATLISFATLAADIDDLNNLKKQALSGNGKAALKLAKLYESGKIDDLSTHAAQDMYRFAFTALTAEAKEGKTSSMLKLAQLYGQGKGTVASSQEALKWLKRALGQNSPKAQLIIGKMALWGDFPDHTPMDGLLMLQEATRTNTSTTPSSAYELGIAYATGIASAIHIPFARLALRQAIEGKTADKARTALKHLSENINNADTSE